MGEFYSNKYCPTLNVDSKIRSTQLFGQEYIGKISSIVEEQMKKERKVKFYIGIRRFDPSIISCVLEFSKGDVADGQMVNWINDIKRIGIPKNNGGFEVIEKPI